MEAFSRHAAVRILPFFGVTPEALNAVDMVASDRFALLLANHNMLAAHL